MDTPELSESKSSTPAATMPQSPKDDPLQAGAPKGESKEPQQLQKLSYLLDQSNIYSKIIGEKMARERKDRREADARASKKEAAGKAPVKGKKRKAVEMIGDVLEEGDLAKGKKSERLNAATEKVSLQARQPALVTGATLKDYQLDGVEWMVSLFTNGLSGILADEMGLGKTIQTIAFLAHIREKGVWGPFLIVCPLSTVANWVSEFERFTPDIPVVLYHGSQEERADIRHKRLGLGAPRQKKSKGKKKKVVDEEDVETHKKPEETFPVIVTSYEMVMNDKKFLQKIGFKYIVVDESHRLKNLNCKLVRELKEYTSANRLLLTGTPLHNNLTELWSLLNFILPDIFDDLDSFSKWFDFSDIESDTGHANLLSQEQSHHIVSNLHAILKPFLLRRLKKDVETNLPPKKEYLLSAPLTAQQKELYDAVINRSIRSFLMEKKMQGDDSDHEDLPLSATSAPAPKEEGSARKKRKTRARTSFVEKTDEQYFEDLDSGLPEDSQVPQLSLAERSKLHQQKLASKSVNNMKLQNLVMQLRKVCNHPWLFDWPIDPNTGVEAVNEDLINASGKMLLLNKLLTELFAKGHKVLLFSQFTSMLDIIQDWAMEYKGWNICRIDGSTKQQDRRDQMKAFSEEKGKDAPNLFLLSTRAGGVGINLVASDTVILFDSDWNPQQDLQAQDRAHRIGQTKPVLVFRFVTGNTIESHILKKAGAKRKLEALVIGQGEFKLPGGADVTDVLMGKKRDGINMADLAETLLRKEMAITLAGKDDEIISKRQLETLLDRSPEAMARNSGWSSGDAMAEVFETEAIADEEDAEVQANVVPAVQA